MNGKNRKKPNIVVSEVDYERLMGLASNASERFEEIAEELMAELDRAKVVTAKRIPENVVQMARPSNFAPMTGMSAALRSSIQARRILPKTAFPSSRRLARR
ncbi:regulator of nucleoside diphosphate kinase [Brucella melitensis]|uniref:Regulator of nucleoside diphosphate kinase n=1 Tax=Brucella melitensis biotype 1 (strain ATCC 23456 / CCUG 17765 / NCTC 10094 / 16M) TaxID=224914 RepID=Q8YC75_BRUME|nr:regulator of nucleoside diphosphate kinase [Brucella melitensis bv. 1 str. 16M]ADZ67836.1 nucleoside diphosphate kinase regulator [Brucella melitensis M28]ADZ88703.1 nucleoside diphosphate kinase regulator [Brucella melitensis M5-90]AIJ86991.1 prokaryotic transcription elongation factor GreA/GreB [Brucella melitensis bv. 3 str. Ether]AIJ94865.1 prokaryotic transcription elongation factor GreA/GreB [Brucella melitensis bv. 2 str. 63/9]ALM36052.1 regulator of nucleoside diphosphate kinase [Br